MPPFRWRTATACGIRCGGLGQVFLQVKRNPFDHHLQAGQGLDGLTHAKLATPLCWALHQLAGAMDESGASVANHLDRLDYGGEVLGIKRARALA